MELLCYADGYDFPVLRRPLFETIDYVRSNTGCLADGTGDEPGSFFKRAVLLGRSAKWNLIKMCSSRLEHVDDQDLYEVYITIKPEREGGNPRNITLRQAEVAFLDGPNGKVGSFFVSRMPCIRMAAAEPKAEEWLSQLEELCAKAKGFLHAVSQDEDSRA